MYYISMSSNNNNNKTDFGDEFIGYISTGSGGVITCPRGFNKSLYFYLWRGYSTKSGQLVHLLKRTPLEVLQKVFVKLLPRVNSQPCSYFDVAPVEEMGKILLLILIDPSFSWLAHAVCMRHKFWILIDR